MESSQHKCLKVLFIHTFLSGTWYFHRWLADAPLGATALSLHLQLIELTPILIIIYFITYMTIVILTYNIQWLALSNVYKAKHYIDTVTGKNKPLPNISLLLIYTTFTNIWSRLLYYIAWIYRGTSGWVQCDSVQLYVTKQNYWFKYFKTPDRI